MLWWMQLGGQHVVLLRGPDGWMDGEQWTSVFMTLEEFIYLESHRGENAAASGIRHVVRGKDVVLPGGDFRYIQDAVHISRSDIVRAIADAEPQIVVYNDHIVAEGELPNERAIRWRQAGIAPKPASPTAIDARWARTLAQVSDAGRDEDLVGARLLHGAYWIFRRGEAGQAYARARLRDARAPAELRLALATLALFENELPGAFVPFLTHRSSAVAASAFAALARLLPAARTELEALSVSKKAAEREAARALLAIARSPSLCLARENSAGVEAALRRLRHRQYVQIGWMDLDAPYRDLVMFSRLMRWRAPLMARYLGVRAAKHPDHTNLLPEFLRRFSGQPWMNEALVLHLLWTRESPRARAIIEAFAKSQFGDAFVSLRRLVPKALR